MRRFLWVAAALILVVAAAYAGFRWRDAAAWRQAELVPVVDLGPGTVKRAGDVYVTMQPNGQYRVFLARPVFYPDRELVWTDYHFIEPVSRAEYDISGAGVFGPAGDLYQVEARLEWPYLRIRSDHVISGGPGDPAWLSDLKVRFRWLTSPLP